MLYVPETLIKPGWINEWCWKEMNYELQLRNKKRLDMNCYYIATSPGVIHEESIDFVRCSRPWIPKS